MNFVAQAWFQQKTSSNIGVLPQVALSVCIESGHSPRMSVQNGSLADITAVSRQAEEKEV
jgi:hypothetical protein